jgi:hypothetical protein
MRECSAAESNVNWQETTAYRVRQFWRGLNAQVDGEELRRVASILPPAAISLFQSMPRDAQRHSLNVLAMLEANSDIPHDLAVAALLHDVGKTVARRAGVQLSLWMRGPMVILERLAPALTVRMTSDDPIDGWRYLLYVHVEHPRLGAQLAAEAGCSQLACWLIEQHQNREIDDRDARSVLLRQLQWADNQN